MKVKEYIDFAKQIQVEFEVNGDKITYDYICNEQNEKLKKNIIQNLKIIDSFVQTDNPDVYRLYFHDELFIDINKRTMEIAAHNSFTSFETRILAQGDALDVPFDRLNKPSFRPRTDLHTHFAGAMRVETLVDVAKKYDLEYPAAFLKEMGIKIISYKQTDDGKIKVNDLNVYDLNLFMNSLRLPTTTQDLFEKMETIYKWRGPLTKDKNLFHKFLYELANDYKANGIDYVELSYYSFMRNKDFLKVIHAVLPVIEQKTGVKIRFLASFARSSDKEYMMDDVDILNSAISNSPYIVGADFMGHEINETSYFEEELRGLAKHAMLEDPEFNIRVHAGENIIFKDNIKQALTIVKDEHDKLEKELGKKLPYPRIRIGHGLYGVDEEVLMLAKEIKAVIEFNMSSNLALNNINGIEDVPIKQYIDAGVNVVLATDGHGLYTTSSEQEVLLASFAGLTNKDFEKIKETENEIIMTAERREKKKTMLDVDKIFDMIKYNTPDNSARYTKEVAKLKEQEAEQTVKRIKDAIAATGAETNDEKIKEAIKGKIPIVLSGASKSSWPNISEENQQKIRQVLKELVQKLDPDKVYFITGGTNFGVEKQLHEIVNEFNKTATKKFTLLGTFTLESEYDIKNVEPNTITHATLLKLDDKYTSYWKQLPDTQLQEANANNGMLIAIGGGSTVLDMIQRGHNINVPMALMDGVEGASSEKAKHMKGNNYAFTDIDSLTRLIAQNNIDALLESPFISQNVL